MTQHATYLRFELFSALRKVDVQFSCIALVTGLVFFPGAPGPYANAALGATVALFVVELVWERAGNAGIARESARALALFWALSLPLPAFIVALMAEAAGPNALFSRAAQGTALREHILALGAGALVTRAATVAASVALFRDFGPAYVDLRRILEGDRKAAFARGRVIARQGARAPAPAGAGAGAGAAAEPAAAPGLVAVENPAAGAGEGAPSAASAVQEWAASAGAANS